MISFFHRIGLKIKFGRLAIYPKYIASTIRWWIRMPIVKRKDAAPILIFGMPKSGSTALENIIKELLGFPIVMPPEATAYEFTRRESHSYVLSSRVLRTIENKNVILKVHGPPSSRVLNWAKYNAKKTLVIYRDLNEVKDSHYHYVVNTLYHPENSVIKKLNKIEYSDYWRNNLQNDFENWKNSWLYFSEIHQEIFVIDYNELKFNRKNLIREISNCLRLGLKEHELEQVFSKTSKEAMKESSVQKSFFTREGL